MDTLLKGKRALITGSTSGIGAHARVSWPPRMGRILLLSGLNRLSTDENSALRRGSIEAVDRARYALKRWKQHAGAPRPRVQYPIVKRLRTCAGFSASSMMATA